MTITDQYGSIDKKKAREAGYAIEDGNAWITKEADVLIPAAIEGQINAETVLKISQTCSNCCRRRQWTHHPGSG